MFRDLILRLDQWLAANRPDYYRQLQPGLDTSQLQEFQANLGMQLPEELQELYRWRNGQSRQCFSDFQMGRQFASAESALESKQVLDELLDAGEFELENWWDRNWIPFLDSGSGNHLCLDMAGAFTSKPGQLIAFDHEAEFRDIEYPSLEKWLEVFVGSLERGHWQAVRGDMFPLGEGVWEEYCLERIPGYPLHYSAGAHSPHAV